MTVRFPDRRRSAAGTQGVEDAAARAAVARHPDVRLVLRDRLTRARADRAIGLAHVVAAAQELLLHLLALGARQPAVVGRPGRADAARAAQAVRQDRDG